MTTASTRNFFRVTDIAERDLDYLTELKDRIESPSLGTTADAKEAIRRLYVRVFTTMIESAYLQTHRALLEEYGNLLQKKLDGPRGGAGA